MAARNDPTKGWGVLIEAIKSLDSKILAKSKFVFYGFKPECNMIFPKNVQIHPFTKRFDVLAALNNADVAIVPSWVDNSPIQFMKQCLLLNLLLVQILGEYQN